MHFNFLNAVTLLGGVISLVDATFPSEPIAIEGTNITETTPIGTVAECQAIAVLSSTEDTKCGETGIISARGIYAVNVWPNQPAQSSVAKCAFRCQNLVGDYYRSFGVYSTKSNMTTGYSCECYDTGVGTLKLMAATKSANLTVTGSGSFYDSACFKVEC